MKRTTALYSFATAVTVVLAGCSGTSQSPLSPSPALSTGVAAEAGAPSLKVSAPTPASPVNGATASSTRPTFTFTAAKAADARIAGAALPLVYRVQIFNEAGTMLQQGTVKAGSGNTVSFKPASGLPLDTKLGWQVRAELDGANGPYAPLASFRTPAVNVVDGGGPVIEGPTGPRRGIGLNEAFNIIVRIHNEKGFNLGSGSSRQSRVDFLWSAVAAIHYGHPRFNPAGGDPGWCVKDAGGGRPPSDDVLVRCSTREAWDLVLGAGGSGYHFHHEFLGRLSGSQNVYPPPRSALSRLD